MEGIRQWAFSVCAAMVACGLAQLVLPKSNLEKMFRLTVSVFFLCCLLSPVVLSSPQLRIELNQIAQEEIDARAKNLLNVVDRQTERQASDSLSKIIREKLGQMGINYHDITINMIQNGQSGQEIDSVDITLDMAHEADHRSIQKELESALGLTVRLGYREGEEEPMNADME